MEKVGEFVSYEEVPYLSLPSPHSHPGAMAAVARLLGLEAPPVDRCRVLEIGCGTSPNLLPMAADLPEAEFVGIDRSPRQIAMSREAAAELGLRNVRLRELDIVHLADLAPSLGPFDYVIAHGIYSWVPAPVRDKLLQACAALLGERGLVYVSYNVYPGWHLINVLRDLMLYHVQGVEDPAERARKALEAADLIVDGVTERSDGMARIVQSYVRNYRQLLDRLGPNRDSALHHDLLAEVNDPVYFHDFVVHAERHGLQFAAEAAFSMTIPPSLPKEVRDRLVGSVASPEAMEQYMDFLMMRTLRQTLLCRSGRPLSRALQPERVRGLYVRTTLRPEAPRPDLASVLAERFHGPDGASISTNHPLTKAGLCVLAELQPRSLSFLDLVREARARLGEAPRPGDEDGSSDDAMELARILLRTFAQRRDLITLRAHAPVVAGGVSERPLARPLARWQAQRTPVVTNAYHDGAPLAPLQQAVLGLLDGTRDRQALLGALCGLTEQGRLPIERDGQPITAPDQVRFLLERELDGALERLAGMGLLIA